MAARLSRRVCEGPLLACAVTILAFIIRELPVALRIVASIVDVLVLDLDPAAIGAGQVTHPARSLAAVGLLRHPVVTIGDAVKLEGWVLVLPGPALLGFPPAIWTVVHMVVVSVDGRLRVPTSLLARSLQLGLAGKPALLSPLFFLLGLSAFLGKLRGVDPCVERGLLLFRRFCFRLSRARRRLRTTLLHVQDRVLSPTVGEALSYLRHQRNASQLSPLEK